MRRREFLKNGLAAVAGMTVSKSEGQTASAMGSRIPPGYRRGSTGRRARARAKPTTSLH